MYRVVDDTDTDILLEKITQNGAGEDIKRKEVIMCETSSIISS